jgi:pimeloyl-ACP methyl ester carboxylesterase
MKRFRILTLQVMLSIMLLAATSVFGASTDYVLKDLGSFYIGGESVTLSGLPMREIVFTKGAPPMKSDPNGDFEVKQMYVQYFIPAKQKSKYPLLMWHGGGLTGVTWETKPDGKPGWMNYFLKAGHAVYVSDAVERGRASWARYPEIFTSEPFFRSKKEGWELFRIGPVDSYNTDPAKRVAFPGEKFPVAAFDQFCKESVPRWATNDASTQAAYNDLVQKVGSCVVMVHSQGGNFGFNAALAAPDKVKAIIAIEPSGAPNPGPELEKIKNIPILMVWGDYFDASNVNGLWKKIMAAPDAFAKDLRARGGKVDWVDLPKVGISGNTHMLMMDTNSDQVAELIQKWMKKNGLMK